MNRELVSFPPRISHIVRISFKRESLNFTLHHRRISRLAPNRRGAQSRSSSYSRRLNRRSFALRSLLSRVIAQAFWLSPEALDRNISFHAPVVSVVLARPAPCERVNVARLATVVVVDDGGGMSWWWWWEGLMGCGLNHVSQFGNMRATPSCGHTPCTHPCLCFITK